MFLSYLCEIGKHLQWRQPFIILVLTGPCDQRITHSLLLCHILSNVQDFKRRVVAYPDHANEKRFLPYKIFRPSNFTFISRSQIFIHKGQYLRPNWIIPHFWKNIGEMSMAYRELDWRATMMIKRSTVELKKFMCRTKDHLLFRSLFNFLNYFVRLRITDEGVYPKCAYGPYC